MARSGNGSFRRTSASQIALVLLMVPICTAAITAQDTDLVALILELLQDRDRDMRALALEQIRSEAKGAAATQAFAHELDRATPQRQPDLIRALADRGDPLAKPHITALLESNHEPVRIAAIRAISKLGDTTDCRLLVERLARNPSDDERSAIEEGLIQLQGEGVESEIANQITGASLAVQTSLMEVLTVRRAVGAIPELLKVALGNDPAARTAAMTGLGKLASEEHIPDLVHAVLKARPGPERRNAERSVMQVCQRIDGQVNRAKSLIAAVERLPAADQVVMLVTLGRVGGNEALKRIEEAIANGDSSIHAAGISAIASWPDASVSDRLIELAFNDPHLSHQLTTLRALIRIAPIADGRDDADKLALLKRAMEMSIRYADRNYALQRASAIRSLETLRFVLPFLDDPNYAEQAGQTIVELAHIRDLRDSNKKEFHAALDKVIAISKDPVILDRANRYKNGQTWVRPK